MALMFLFDDTRADAAGAPINGKLGTGDLSKETFGRNMPIRVSRTFYDLQSNQTTPIVVQSQIFAKSQPQEDINSPVNASPIVVLDDDYRHDYRVVGKIFQFQLTTESLCSLSDWSALVEPAGGRV